MSVIAAIMRIFSFVFHSVLAFFMLAVSMVALLNGSHNLQIELLPWTGAALTYWLLGLGLAGLVIVLLALRGTLRILFLLWAVAVVIALVRGYIFSPYLFDDWSHFRSALYFILASVVAAVGGWLQYRRAAAR